MFMILQNREVIKSNLYCISILKEIALSYRSKLQQQSSHVEELERQKAELADLQQVTRCNVPREWAEIKKVLF